MTTDRYATGMTTRRAVLGDAHVDRAEAAKSDFDKPFQDMITEGAWACCGARMPSPPRTSAASRR